jgi:hypothetical protein
MEGNYLSHVNKEMRRELVMNKNQMKKVVGIEKEAPTRRRIFFAWLAISKQRLSYAV